MQYLPPNNARGQNMNSQQQAKVQEILDRLSRIRHIQRALYQDLQKINTQINRNTNDQHRLEAELAQIMARDSIENTKLSKPASEDNNSPNS
jgi:regulator of replication initiation timing